MVDSFSSSYSEARGKFLAAACDAKARIHTYGRADIRGKDDEYLASDVAVFGPDNAERAAIVVTGTHGSEGYCASAILHQWLSRRAATDIEKDLKLVLVHAINPWAYSHKTRATENNVDLNRNFHRDAAAFERDNSSYDRLMQFLHPASLEADQSFAAYQAYKSYLDQHGSHIEGESWAGQGQHPDGLFYFGKRPEWSNEIFRRIIREHVGNAGSIGFIDWHTGIGRYGEIVFLIFDEEGSPEHAAASKWWDQRKSAGGAFSAGTVPKYEGLLCKAIRQELPASKIAGAVVEFGTADDYAMFRADRLDRWLRFEGRDDPQHNQLREIYADVCCPNDAIWRRFVLAEGVKIMDRLIDGVLTWEA